MTQQNNSIDISTLENIKIRNIKYKVYIFLIFVATYVFWWSFVNSFATVKWLKENLSTVNNKITDIDRKIMEWRKINETINFAKQKKTETIDCINNPECKQTSLINDFWSVKNNLKVYFQLSQLDETKMDYNQKLILQNMDEFLLKTPLWQYNWVVNIISFWVPVVVDYDKNIYKLPITLNIDFSDKNNLLMFLDNIENKITTDNNMYYTIDTLNYNVANYSTNQTVNMSVNAYFYK